MPEPNETTAAPDLCYLDVCWTCFRLRVEHDADDRCPDRDSFFFTRESWQRLADMIRHSETLPPPTHIRPVTLELDAGALAILEDEYGRLLHRPLAVEDFLSRAVNQFVRALASSWHERPA